MHRFVIFSDHSCQISSSERSQAVHCCKKPPVGSKAGLSHIFYSIHKHIPCKKFICTCFAKTDIFIHRAKTRYNFILTSNMVAPAFLLDFPCKIPLSFLHHMVRSRAHENLRILSKQRIITPHHIQMARIQIGLPFTSPSQRSQAAACPVPEHTPSIQRAVLRGIHLVKRQMQMMFHTPAGSRSGISAHSRSFPTQNTDTKFLLQILQVKLRIEIVFLQKLYIALFICHTRIFFPLV